MLAYLRDFLRARNGSAPVYATIVGTTEGARFVMRAVDETGVVLSPHSGDAKGVAYPWASVQSITPIIAAKR